MRAQTTPLRHEKPRTRSRQGIGAGRAGRRGAAPGGQRTTSVGVAGGTRAAFERGGRARHGSSPAGRGARGQPEIPGLSPRRGSGGWSRAEREAKGDSRDRIRGQEARPGRKANRRGGQESTPRAVDALLTVTGRVRGNSSREIGSSPGKGAAAGTVGQLTAGPLPQGWEGLPLASIALDEAPSPLSRGRRGQLPVVGEPRRHRTSSRASDSARCTSKRGTGGHAGPRGRVEGLDPGSFGVSASAADDGARRHRGAVDRLHSSDFGRGCSVEAKVRAARAPGASPAPRAAGARRIDIAIVSYRRSIAMIRGMGRRNGLGRPYPGAGPAGP